MCAFSVHHTWRVRWKVLGAGVDEGLGTLRWQGSGTWRARLRSRFRAGAEMFVALVRFEGLQPGLFRLVFSPQVFDQHIRSCGQNDAGYPKKETVSTNSHQMLAMGPLEVKVAKWRLSLPHPPRIPSMPCMIEAGASSATSIALRTKFSELVSKCSRHAMQHVRTRACILSRYSRVL